MKKHIAFILFSATLFACAGDQETQTNTDEREVTPLNEKTPERSDIAKKVFYTIPSPLETASIFEVSGAEYTSEYLNPRENVNNYITSSEKALNFGVYGADLSYTNIFDQSQESMFYMSCTKKLADGLGITSAFDAATMERIEGNINNRDSLMIIINDAFWIADAYLKENEQENISALIIAGGWIEGLYLGTKTLNMEHPNKELLQQIADQKHSLKNLLGLLATYNNEEVTKVETQLKELDLIFDNITEESNETNVSKNEETGVSTIGGGSTLHYETETINDIASKIEEIRNEIIQ